MSRRARRQQPLGMARAVAALARKSAALLHEDFSLVVGEDGAKRMVARVSRAFRGVEGAAQQRLVIKAGGRGSIVVEDDLTAIRSASRTVPIASNPAPWEPLRIAAAKTAQMAAAEKAMRNWTAFLLCMGLFPLRRPGLHHHA